MCVFSVSELSRNEKGRYELQAEQRGRDDINQMRRKTPAPWLAPDA